jgi:peptidyl-prolyl cis-trans isomerase SurA
MFVRAPFAFLMMLLMLSVLFANAAMVAAQDRELGIVAIINDDIISNVELEDRMRLLFATTGRVPSTEQLPAVREQILQTMIDDALKLQDAKRFSITVTEDEIRRAIAGIEAERQQPEGSLTQFLQANNLSLDSLNAQMRVQVAWRKLLARILSRDIAVSDEEVRVEQQRAALGRDIAEARIASVLLPHQEGLSQEQLVALGGDIRSQLLRGADAGKLLADYSDRVQLEFAPVVWIAQERMASELADVINRLSVGDISDPITTPLGVQLVRLLERRVTSSNPQQNAEVAVKQIILKLDEQSMDAEIDSKMEIAREIARHPGSCMEMGIAGLQQFDGLNIEVNYYRTTTASMSPEIRSLIEPLPITGITAPFASNDGIHLLMLCERITVPPQLPDAAMVREALLEEKLQLEAEKYLRQLRRNAFIDVRL